MRKYLIDWPVKWYMDNKLMLGIIIVIINFILGFYAKIVIFANLTDPIGFTIGMLLYALSWILLFLGVFLVGWSTVKKIKRRLHRHVKKTMKRTYHHAKKLPGRATTYSKELHKKGISKIQEASDIIARKIKEQDD